MHPANSTVSARPDIAASLMEIDIESQMMGMIGYQVFPIFPTMVKKGDFGRLKAGDLVKTAETRRAPRASYARGETPLYTFDFSCKEHGFEELVDQHEAEVFRDYYDAEVLAAKVARGVVMRNAESRVAGMVFNPTTYTGSSLTTAVGTEWSDASGSDPVLDVKNAKTKVYEQTGIYPNALAINRTVFDNIVQTAAIRDRISSSGAGTDTKTASITQKMVAEVLGLEKVLVAGGVRNTANEGAAAAISQIWSSEYAMVCRVPTTMDLSEPGIGRTFHYTGDGSMPNGIVETYEENNNRSTVVRARHDVDEKSLYVETGHLLSNITA